MSKSLQKTVILPHQRESSKVSLSTCILILLYQDIRWNDLKSVKCNIQHYTWIAWVTKRAFKIHVCITDLIVQLFWYFFFNFVPCLDATCKYSSLKNLLRKSSDLSNVIFFLYVVFLNLLLTIQILWLVFKIQGLKLKKYHPFVTSYSNYNELYHLLTFLKYIQVSKNVFLYTLQSELQMAYIFIITFVNLLDLSFLMIKQTIFFR